MVRRLLFSNMTRREKDLTVTAKVLIWIDVAAAAGPDGTLPRGTWTLTATKHSVTRQQVAVFWRAHGDRALVPATARPIDHDAIQALQQKRRSKTLEDLVLAVEESFVELKREALANVFCT